LTVNFVRHPLTVRAAAVDTSRMLPLNQFDRVDATPALVLSRACFEALASTLLSLLLLSLISDSFAYGLKKRSHALNRSIWAAPCPSEARKSRLQKFQFRQ
jgi:hypothetical protein